MGKLSMSWVPFLLLGQPNLSTMCQEGGTLCAAGKSTTINREGGSGHECRLIGAEPDDKLRHFLRQAKPAHRYGLSDLRATLLAQRLDAVSQDGAGRDGVDADVAL